MSTPEPTIDALRQEIDAVDDAIHDLLIRRTEIAQRIGGMKDTTRGIIRPGREAAILRRLCERHTGSLPKGVLVRLWREMIGALTRLQGPLSIAVYAPDDRRLLWDITRDHYGSFTPITPVNTPFAAIRAVCDGTATVGVVPYPTDGETDPWWRFLSASDAKLPRVVARLPFCPRSNGLSESIDGLALAMTPLEATTEDRTLISVEITGDISRGRLKEGLESAGLQVFGIAGTLIPGSPDVVLHLVDVASFIAPEDGRLDTVAKHFAPLFPRIAVIGGYATPIQPR